MTADTTSEWSGFAAALRHPGTPPPPGLRAWNGSDVARRFDVHRNTFVVTLVQALGETLPVCRQALGAECFDALARAFVLAAPPDSPVLAEWGDGFAPWLAGFGPAADWPWLPGLARLERARIVAFHAADAAPLGAADIAPALVDAAQLAGMKLVLHPSCQVLQEDWGVVSLWAAHQQPEGPPQDLAVFERHEAALVLRDDTATGGGEVTLLPLPLAAARCTAALQRGRPLAEAVAEAGSAPEPLDLAALLALLIRHGALAGWRRPGDDE
jgi:hypothetical protein